MNVEIRNLGKEELAQIIAEHRALNPDLPIKPDTLEALTDYATRRVPLGDFLTAVISNDLMGAMARADSYNRATIFQICEFVYNKMPHNCHGSRDAYRKWLAGEENE